MKKITLLFAILFAAGLNSSRAQDTWTQKADFGGVARAGAFAFSIGSKGYTGAGFNNSIIYGEGYKDFWEYDSDLNAWSQKADLGGVGRAYATGFSIGSLGYVGGGNNNISLDDFWEYNPASNQWAQKASFGGGTIDGAVSFSIDNKGYIGTGSNDYDFWEYDPPTDIWTQKANFGGSLRGGGVGFSIDNKGYIGTGRLSNGTYTNDFWEYDPTSDSWTQKANFGGTARFYATGFSIGTKGYIGNGYDGSYRNDFWEYNPSANTWTQKANVGGPIRGFAVGFSIGSTGYIGTGTSNNNWFKDFWEYTPDTTSCAVPTNLSVTNITSSSAKLNWDAVAGAEGYKIRYKVSGTNQWTLKNSNGNSKNLHNLSPNTNYTWEVKTFCSINPGFSSDWSAKQKFTTGNLRMGDESAQQVSFQVYPNPAEDHATIQFTLAQPSHVYIKVYDVSGKEIEVLLDENVKQGNLSVPLNTNHFSKGVYLVRMISDFGIENQKLIVQ